MCIVTVTRSYDGSYSYIHTDSMKRRWLLLLLLPLLALPVTAQFDPNRCGKPKCETGGKFNYKPGIKYEYQYLVDIESLFEGTSKNSSSLHIDADVTVMFNSQCEGYMSFSKLRLGQRENEGPDHEHSEVFSNDISRHTLRFAFHDGIVTEICPSMDEPNWVLNFKRGALTMFHNTMRRFDLDHEVVETDVHGICDTKYLVMGSRNTSLIIQKTKDISSCQHRYKHQSILQTTPYTFRSNYQAIPIMKSNVTCELSIDHHVYNEIVCHESHVFQPFSNNAAGATTAARQKLVLVAESVVLGHEEKAGEHVDQRAALLYNHNATPKPMSGELRESRDLIKKLCKLSTDDMQIEFSNLFTKFIHTARLLSHVALQQLYNRASAICSTGKKHMLDALPFLGSSGAVNVMKDIIIEGGVPKETAHEWLVAFSFIPRPDEATLRALLDLLGHTSPGPHYDPAVALSVSAVAHSYCRHHANCRDNEVVQAIVAELEQRVTLAYHKYRDERITREIIMVSFKAIANIGLVSEHFERIMWEIIVDDDLPPEIRVSAVDAHRRLPCLASRDRFLELFRNQTIDTEVRIAAYLQVMRCPDYITIRVLRHCLEEEEVNQVGSFIWSHLHNLLKSSIPSRIEIQGLLSDKDLGKKFSSDVRKFSHNYEGSVFFDEYNAGANYESNVIFSPSSYVPKSAMLNLTVDLFGESINLFEVNGRAEGLEHYFESMFGPKGPLNTRYFENKLAKIRWPRSAPSYDDNEVLKTDIADLPDIVTDKFGAPKVSLGLKVFGNELKYHTFSGDEEIKGMLRTLNPMNYIKRMLSGKEINYNKAAMFLDTSYIVPSGAGLPITLNAVGTAAINLKMYGALRAADFTHTKELDLAGRIRPSATVDVIGTMSVDAYYAATGIKLKTNVYTSTAVEGKVKVRGAQLVSVRFSLPNEKTEIFSAHSEVVVMRGDVEERQRGVAENRVEQSMCSWPGVDKTIGLRICGEYQFPNVTKNDQSPYFVLAGPSKFRISLQKDDPTARDYVFEYRMNKTSGGSVVSMSFDTPGSSVKRLLAANFTLDVQSQNLTVVLETAAGTTLAKGKYKNTDDEKYLYLGLDIDGKKHFDARLSLTRKESKHGYTYQPKFYLGVNDERVAELNGTLKNMTKKGISQWDVLLNFQTKRLVTHLNGTITRSESSLATRLNLKYRFLNGPEERVHTEFKISNRSTNNIKSIQADLRLECSAYPQFNFEAVLKLQRALGHVDCKLEVNSMPHLADPNHTLTAQFVFITTNMNDGRRINTFLEVRKPATQLDVKLQYRYDQAGPKTNMYMLCRYARDKDISVQLYLSTPRGSLFFMEGKLNVTVPSFTPMVLEGSVHEKTTSKFDVELQAVWFSGHNFTASGRYEDKSTLVASSYHLKLLIQSPSFHEINLGCSFYRNREELKLEIKAEHNAEIYALMFEHRSSSSKQIFTQAEIRYKGKTYSVKSTINLKDYRQIMLEVHLDTARDIELMVRAMNKKERKELGIEIKWDANRDPDQKLMASVEFGNPEPYTYNSNFVLSYPGRSINGIFDFAIRDDHFRTFVRVAWSPTDAIDLKLSADYKYDVETLITIKSELLTPFDNWKRTSINGGYRHLGNLYHANGSVYWLENQYVSLDVFGNYSMGSDSVKCEFSGSVHSTLPKIPSVSGRLVHFHNTTKSDSDLHITYDPKKIIWVKSVWQISQDEKMRNLTGTMSLKSPFQGYQKGLLVSKIYMTKNMDIRGVADLDLDYKKYTASVEGHLQRVSESMFFFNITTPIEKYSKLTGRFGFSEQKRHLVAEVRAPSGAVGVEVLFYILNISDFDVKFNLATPIDFLQNVLVVATLKNDTIDFRLGWNQMTAGFTGVWRYVDLTDFEYSYKIYTPIEGLEQNGVVAKFVLKNGLDMEFSAQLANTKVGVAVVGKPKPKLLKELGVKKTAAVYTGSRDDPASAEDEDEDSDESKEEISWGGLVQLDTIVWPTIKGTLDIDQTGPTYIVLVTLTLPDGVAELRDEFYFSDILNLSNDLHVTTPYDNYKTVTSIANVDVIIGTEYNIAFDLNILNITEWIQLGAKVHYVHDGGVDDVELHNATLHIHTPFVGLPRLDMHAGLEIEENVYRINFTLATNRTDISVSGSGEADEGYLDTWMKMHVKSPSLNLPPTEFRLKKDFSSAENVLEVLLNVERSAQTQYTVKSLWYVRSLKHFKVELKTEVPIPPFEHFDAGVAVFGDTEVKSAAMRLVVPPHSIAANTTVKDNIVHATLEADVAGHNHELEFNGNIVKLSEKQHNLAGVLRYLDARYDVTGNMAMYNDMPAAMNLELVPASGGEKITVRYSVQPQESGAAVRSHLKRGDTFATLEAHVTCRHKFDWDLHVQVDTSLQSYKRAIVDAKMMTPSVNNMSFIFQSTTPFRGLEHTKLGYSVLTKEVGGNLRLFHELTTTRGETNINWRWILLEDMSVNLIGSQQIADGKKTVAMQLFYVNPNKTFEHLKLGGDLDVDNGVWTLGSNVTLSIKEKEKIDVEANLKLPLPKKDVHNVRGYFLFTKGLGQVKYLASYRTIETKQNYAASGTMFVIDKLNMKGNLKVEWGPHVNQTANNLLDLKYKDKQADMKYRLQIAQNAEDTFNTRLTYGGDVAYHNVTAILFCPASRQIADVKVDFRELINMNGTVNVSTPFAHLPFAGAHFLTQTKLWTQPVGRDSNRRVEAFWPNNTALIDSRYKIRSHRLGTSQVTGDLLLDVPLTTRHVTKVDYGYDTKPQQATGHATINYNKNKIVEGKYKCDSENRAGFDKDTMNVEVENKFAPIGVTYIHQFEYSAPGGGSNLPTVDMKHVEVFNLHNRTGFNVTGEMHVNTTETGKQITIVAIHSNRTVTLDADYDVQDQRFIQKSRLQLAPTVWFAYDLDIINKTEDESKEAQQIEINVSYPRRNFTLLGSYAVTDSSLFSEASLVWDRAIKLKQVEASFDWQQISETPNHQLVELQIKHPSFERNVSFKGEYYANETRLADVRVDVVYSNDPEKEVHLSALLEDHSNDSVKNVTFEISGTHPATNLELLVQGDVFSRKKFYNAKCLAHYQRTFLPLQSAVQYWTLDIENYEAEYRKITELNPTHYWAKYEGGYPLYTANMTALRGSDINYSGEFYLHFREKVLRCDMNMTEDGSQSFHMYGVIPDARSATFNVWRDYVDLRETDIAYFLRLNHSRLLVSSLWWRPDLKSDIKAAVKAASIDMYNNFTNDVYYWKQYIRHETSEAIKDVWEDAKPIVQEFLDDIEHMKVLMDDIEELKTFLNESYHANEFYIRDIVNAGMYVIDELSIRSHIESLPAIVNEIWEVMGESGEAIRKSILWIVQTVKESYRKAAEFINGLVRGDSLERLSEFMEKFVEKYDKFVKDLNVWFIQYMEQLWEQLSVTLADNWRKMLQTIEPTFISFAHYVESIVYQASKELLDFFYKHTSEIVESPYFTKFSLFTQDLDRLYKDFSQNDIFTLMYKYTSYLVNFIKEKYASMIPFGKELNDLASEILNELRELKKLASIQYITTKVDEWYSKLKWFYDYFDVGNRVRYFIRVLHQKLTDMTMTALQAENRYREAKTNFIFEPKEGIMYLEQKLPVPWHAFNETPIFEELPEYKSLLNMQNMLVSSNTTFWALYYQYKPYTNPKDWFPPFAAHALIAGSQHYMTFDKQFYEFSGDCTYLLAHDFLDKNFSLAITYDPANKGLTHQLHLLLRDQLIHIDVFANTVAVGNSTVGRLPTTVENDTFVYRDADILTVESMLGFVLRCNMKFDVCMFDVSGYYYGKTAGLWGTINNEPSDDFLASTNQVVGEVSRFASSWALRPRSCAGVKNLAVEPEEEPAVAELCASLFANKVSPLHACFERVDLAPFHTMCRTATTEEQACTSAVAYIQACQVENTPLRIPDVCIKCNLPNGTVIGEGDFIEIHEDDISKTSDVVFIVEAKSCNQNLRQRRNMDSLVSLLDKELTDVGLTKNRYSVVLFGGDGVLAKPRSVVINNEIFATHQQISQYFDDVPNGKQNNSDIFEAIDFATTLVFRPGASRTFILLPCSDCDISVMKLDYTVLHQLLLEYDITLHILMNEEFRFAKSRMNKVFFGMDSKLAYTNKDSRVLKGDADLRKQVRPPKAVLGFCVPLALETNGTVFTGKKLEGDKRNSVKKFAAVFAKRVAKTAAPSPCQICECNAQDSGVAFMECFPCQYPSTAYNEFDFNEDEALSAMQPMVDMDDYESYEE